MKKIQIIGLLVIALTSCAKKQETLVPPVVITGKWFIVNSSIKDYQNGILTSVRDTAENRKDYLMLNDDGTGSGSISGIAQTFRYAWTSGVITFTYPPYNPSNPDEANISTCKILKLNASVFDYSHMDSDTATGQSEITETDFVR